MQARSEVAPVEAGRNGAYNSVLLRSDQALRGTFRAVAFTAFLALRIFLKREKKGQLRRHGIDIKKTVSL